MTRYARSLIFTLVLVGATSAAVSAAPDAGPIAAETSVDAEAASTAAVTDASPAPSSTVVINPAQVDPLGTAGDMYSAIEAGHWRIAIALGLMLLVVGVRWALGRWVAWVRTKPGGYVLGYGSAALVTLALGLRDGGWSLGLLTTAVTTAWIATGGWSAAKDFVAWVRSKLG